MIEAFSVLALGNDAEIILHGQDFCSAGAKDRLIVSKNDLKHSERAFPPITALRFLSLPQVKDKLYATLNTFQVASARQIKHFHWHPEIAAWRSKSQMPNLLKYRLMSGK